MYGSDLRVVFEKKNWLLSGMWMVNCQLSRRCQPEMKWSCLAIIFMVFWSNDRSKFSNDDKCNLIMDK